VEYRQLRILRKSLVRLRELAQIKHRAAIRFDAAHVRAGGAKSSLLRFIAHAKILTAMWKFANLVIKAPPECPLA
jgi:hypothetical protein